MHLLHLGFLRGLCLLRCGVLLIATLQPLKDFALVAKRGRFNEHFQHGRFLHVGDGGEYSGESVELLLHNGDGIRHFINDDVDVNPGDFVLDLYNLV